MINKTPPHSKDAEQVTIGAMLIDVNCLPIAMSKLFEDAFYIETNKKIFKAIRHLYDKSMSIDIITVFEQIIRNNDQADITAYDLTKLTNIITSSAHIEDHIKIILEHYLKRQQIVLGMDLTVKGYDETLDANDSLNKASAAILSIQENVFKASQKKMIDYVMSVKQQRDAIKNTGKIGISTGIASLDAAISGLVAPDLIILAARPGQGKTALALSILHHVSIKENRPAAFFSLEMSGDQLTTRLLSIESGIDHHKIRHASLTHEEEIELAVSEDVIAEAPIYIEDTGGMNIRELRTKASLMKRKYGIDLLIIDYLQLMSGVDEKNKSRENVISEISRGCKLIAKELNIPVLALSQLSRAVESRADKMPQLSDLRESGSIEQDADVVIFIMRPEYYGMIEPVQINGNSYNVQGLAIAKIDKNRHGSTKNIALTFGKEKMKFIDYQHIGWQPMNNFSNTDENGRQIF